MMLPVHLFSVIYIFLLSILAQQQAIAQPENVQPNYLTPEDFENAKNVTEDPEATEQPIREDLFEGDIVGGVNTNRDYGAMGYDSVLRAALKDTSYKWPGAVLPYTLSSSYTSEERAKIAKALADIQANSCVRFKPRTNERNYVRVFKGDGCYSMLGRIYWRSGAQDLSLEVSSRGTCLIMGIIQHEFLHALGFVHEQSRPDRDRYVRVLFQNIKPKLESNFKKYTARQVTYYGVPYDYGSVMHYGRTYLSKNGQPTLLPINPPSARIGQRVRMSASDFKKLNLHYNCKINPPPTPTTTTTRKTTTRLRPSTPKPRGRSCRVRLLRSRFTLGDGCWHLMRSGYGMPRGWEKVYLSQCRDGTATIRKMIGRKNEIVKYVVDNFLKGRRICPNSILPAGNGMSWGRKCCS